MTRVTRVSTGACRPGRRADGWRTDRLVPSDGRHDDAMDARRAGDGRVAPALRSPRAGTRASVLRTAQPRRRSSSTCTSAVPPRARSWRWPPASTARRSGTWSTSSPARGLVTEHRLTASAGPGHPVPSRPPAVARRGRARGGASRGWSRWRLPVIGLGGAVLDQRRVEVTGSTMSPDDAVGPGRGAGRPGLASMRPTAGSPGWASPIPGLTRRSDRLRPRGAQPRAGGSGPRPACSQEAIGLPAVSVRVGNEADLGALGEHRRGAGGGLRHRRVRVRGGRHRRGSDHRRAPDAGSVRLRGRGGPHGGQPRTGRSVGAGRGGAGRPRWARRRSCAAPVSRTCAVAQPCWRSWPGPTPVTPWPWPR